MAMEFIDQAPIDWYDSVEHRRKLAEAINAILDRIPLRGTGSPEGVVVANIGQIFERTDGGAGTSFYVKESDDGLATGWVAK